MRNSQFRRDLSDVGSGMAGAVAILVASVIGLFWLLGIAAGIALPIFLIILIIHFL